MDIKLREIVENINVFSEFSQRELPAKAAFLAAKILGQITEEYNKFQDVRTKTVLKYGEHDENGNARMDENNNVFFTPENRAKLESELNELLDTEVHVNSNPIPLELLDELKFTPAQMYLMRSFIQE